MASDSRNVKLGTCRVKYNGEDLGFTKGGVEVTVETETKKVEVDQFGKTPISEVIMGRTVTAKIPLAETTLENMVKVMPGAELLREGGKKASGSVKFVNSAPTNGDAVEIGGITYTFKTTVDPLNTRDIALPATIEAAASALANAVNSDVMTFVTASAQGAIVTLTAKAYGEASNNTLLEAKFKTAANVVVTAFSGGEESSKVRVEVPSGVGINILDHARELVLHPIAKPDNDTSEDFVIPRAGTAGALNFAYKVEDERVFDTTFNGYADPITNKLFYVGSK